MLDKKKQISKIHLDLRILIVSCSWGVVSLKWAALFVIKYSTMLTEPELNNCFSIISRGKY